MNKLFSSYTVHPLDLDKVCVICRDTSLGYLYRYWGSVLKLMYLYQLVYICVYMTHQVLKTLSVLLSFLALAVVLSVSR